MIVNVGEIVRITESAREEMLACRQEGPDTDAIRENRVGTALEQVGARVGQQSSSPYRMSTLIECDEWSKRMVC